MSDVILAVDLSQTGISMALEQGADVLSRIEPGVQEQATGILPLACVLCETLGITLADVSLFVLCTGPGRFTGLRIAASFIQALAFAYGKPVVLVPTYQLLAQQLYTVHPNHPTEVIFLEPARVDEYYYACYQYQEGDGLMQSMAHLPLRCLSKSDVEHHGIRASVETQPVPVADARFALPYARFLWRTHQTVLAAEALPFYGRLLDVP
jgi:tRNA threonylcarbamoyl adenosine modification protein YeaZ